MTYQNCYELLKRLRQGLGEYSEALVTGLMAGTHSNDYLVDKLNDAQEYIYSLALKRVPGYFLQKASLTAVGSVFTLPADFGKLVLFLDAGGNHVYRATPGQLKKPSGKGYSRLYYHKQNTLVLDKDGVTDTYTLWYRSRPRKLHTGRATATGVETLYIDDEHAVKIDDYYNGMLVENVTAGAIDTITDYLASTRAAVVSGNFTKNDFYGLVSELPETLHGLIGPKALLDIKLTSPLVKQRADSKDISLFNDLLATTFSAWLDDMEDEDLEEVFSDFGPRVRGYGIVAQ